MQRRNAARDAGRSRVIFGSFVFRQSLSSAARSGVEKKCLLTVQCRYIMQLAAFIHQPCGPCADMKVSRKPRPKHRGLSFHNRVRCEMSDRGQKAAGVCTYIDDCHPRKFSLFVLYSVLHREPQRLGLKVSQILRHAFGQTKPKRAL